VSITAEPASPPECAATNARRRSHWPVPLLAALLVYGPMFAAGWIGTSVASAVKGGTQATGMDIYLHNLVLGTAIALLGWASLGVASGFLAVFGSAQIGYVIGAHIGSLGWAPTMSLLPHFVPETLAFTAFTTAGLYGARWVIDVMANEPIRKAITHSARCAAIYLSAGIILVSVAGAIEATTL
jgi:Stage II sporulation protein M